MSLSACFVSTSSRWDSFSVIGDNVSGDNVISDNVIGDNVIGDSVIGEIHSMSLVTMSVTDSMPHLTLMCQHEFLWSPKF